MSGPRVALVTGAGRGVGERIVTELVASGYRVTALDRDPKGLDALAGRLPADQLLTQIADVRERTELARAVSAAADRFGGVDVLVNNAGRWTLGAFVDSDPEQWNDELAINLLGPLHVTQLVLPAMVDRHWGRIVSIISDSGRVGEPNVAVYAAAKAAVAGFSRSLAKEVGRHGITVNCVSLSTTVTPGARETFDERQLEKMPRFYPVPRLGRPEDAAAAVQFFISEQAEWVTGQTLSVNGGYAML